MRALSFLAAAAAGALTAYLFDPEQGRRRRAVARDKLSSGLRRAGDSGLAAVRDLRHRSRGFAAEMRRGAEGTPGDGVLAERVRAGIGRAVSHPGSIEVRVENGRVTLRGPVLAFEAPGLVQAARAVAGVTEVVDELERHAEAGNLPGLQG